MTTTTHDIYNNAPWTDMDIDDLKAAIEMAVACKMLRNFFAGRVRSMMLDKNAKNSD